MYLFEREKEHAQAQEGTDGENLQADTELGA